VKGKEFAGSNRLSSDEMKIRKFAGFLKAEVENGAQQHPISEGSGTLCLHLPLRLRVLKQRRLPGDQKVNTRQALQFFKIRGRKIITYRFDAALLPPCVVTQSLP